MLGRAEYSGVSSGLGRYLWGWAGTPRLIASPAAWADGWKRQKILDLALMLKGAMAAEGKVWLSMNARRGDLDAVLAILPALDTPTVAWLENHQNVPGREFLA